MGNFISNIIIKSKITPNNYKCPSCMEQGQIHNINETIHIISLTEYQCNGCGSIYRKNGISTPLNILNVQGCRYTE